MKRCMFMATICLMLAGCCSYSEVTTTSELAKVTTKKVYLAEIHCADKAAGEVIRDCISQELVKAGIEVTADKEEATITIGGSAVLTSRYYYISVDSISLMAASRSDLIAIATYRVEPSCICTVQKAGKEIGSKLAKKLK